MACYLTIGSKSLRSDYCQHFSIAYQVLYVSLLSLVHQQYNEVNIDLGVVKGISGQYCQLHRQRYELTVRAEANNEVMEEILYVLLISVHTQFKTVI